MVTDLQTVNSTTFFMAILQINKTAAYLRRYPIAAAVWKNQEIYVIVDLSSRCRRLDHGPRRCETLWDFFVRGILAG
jgi:hypothetical protein